MVMTQYNTLNLKLSNSQLNKLKYGIKNETEWWNSNDELIFSISYYWIMHKFRNP